MKSILLIGLLILPLLTTALVSNSGIPVLKFEAWGIYCEEKICYDDITITAGKESAPGPNPNLSPPGESRGGSESSGGSNGGSSDGTLQPGDNTCALVRSGDLVRAAGACLNEIVCADGSVAYGSCPVPTPANKSCPDGSVVSANTECPAPAQANKSCPDGSVVSANTECPAPAQANKSCPDGSVIAIGATCPAITPPVPVPAPNSCPPNSICKPDPNSDPNSPPQTPEQINIQIGKTKKTDLEKLNDEIMKNSPQNFWKKFNQLGGALKPAKSPFENPKYPITMPPIYQNVPGKMVPPAIEPTTPPSIPTS